MNEITFSVERAVIEAALTKALLGHDEPPLLQAARRVVSDNLGARSLSKADIVGLLTPSLTNAEILRKRDGGTP